MASILPLPPAVVGEFVGRSHMDLGRVAELLAEYPTVIHASFDWGNGDFESAIGARRPFRRRDIVDFLLSKGRTARYFRRRLPGPHHAGQSHPRRNPRRAAPRRPPRHLPARPRQKRRPPRNGRLPLAPHPTSQIQKSQTQRQTRRQIQTQTPQSRLTRAAAGISP